MNRSEISRRLKAFLESECKVAVPTDDASLDIDSFNMMLIITYAGEEFSAELNMKNLNFDVMMSLDSITDLIVKEASAA